MRSRLTSRVGAVATIAMLGVSLVTTPAGAVLSVSKFCKTHPHPGIDWHGCDFHNRQVIGAHLYGANLVRTNFSNATVTYTNFTRET